ncbi:hypothetical protein GC207_09195 [bacterium]|nr:hypothetical protein [bacterium]
MKPSSKLLIICLFALVVLGGTAMFIFRDDPAWHQAISLPDGSVLHFRGVTQGTNHVQGNLAGRLAYELPKSIGDWLTRGFPNVFTVQHKSTAEPQTLVWFEVETAPGPSTAQRRAFLTGEGMPVSGESEYVSIWAPPSGKQLMSVGFDSWPRRAKHLEFILYEADASYHFNEVGWFGMKAPNSVTAPAFQPASLPITSSAGDLEVTLMQFATGVGHSTYSSVTSDGHRKVRFNANDPGEAPAAFAVFKVSTPRTNEVWDVAKVWLADAGGNRRKATSWSGARDGILRFSPALWPDEPGWKLILDFKRMQNIPPDQSLTLTNIAMPAIGTTNTYALTNRVNGIQTVFASFVRRPNVTNNSWSSRDTSSLKLEHDTLDERTVVDLISISSSEVSTNLPSSGSSWSDTSYETTLLTIPDQVTHVDLKYAIQRTRRVEFVVAPNWIQGTNGFTYVADE